MSWQNNYLTAIIYCETPQIGTGNHFLKYRRIADTPVKISNFCKFAARFPGAAYVNFYHTATKKFKERIYLQ